MAASTKVTREVLLFLEDGDATLQQIVSATGLTSKQVSNALSYLKKRGDIGKGGRKTWYAFLSRELVE